MKTLSALAVILALSAVSVSAVEIKKDGWLFPQPARAEKKAIRTLDGTNRIPGRETVVKVYKKSDTVVFETFEVEGEVYGCQFHVKGKKGEPATVYAILDRDGDGVFESKYSAGEFPRVPDWVIKRYYKKHGAGKDPGPAADADRGQ